MPLNSLKSLQRGRIEQHDLHDFLIYAPLNDASGNEVEINRRVLRGLSADQIALLELRIIEQIDKMTSIREEAHAADHLV